jgi:5-methylcytosine-specific restriction endonuclease McrA
VTTTKKPSAKQEYRDSRGVAFADVRFMLSERPSGWPKIKRVEDPRVCQLMHELYKRCWRCGAGNVQAHHEFAGSRGASDELTAIFMLCSECHSNVHTRAFETGELLYLKWKHDRLNVDWVRMHLLCGYWLPDLIVRRP